jgi:polyphosphate kinase
LCYPKHRPKTHPRLRKLERRPASIFEEVAAGDILLHHPYQNFETSVLRFLEAATLDPQVLAIKLTIYRTGLESPIIRALAEAARRGKQIAVVVEITARFDEAPNIAWGRYLEKEGVHVAYGVERLKTHVKLALVVREEGDRIRHYAHIGTGNYNTSTARVYEDLGLLTSDPEICSDVAAVFNSLTGAHQNVAYRKMLVAPRNMRTKFMELIRREAEHARQGRPAGIYAKMNQLQDPDIISELYKAGRAGVKIRLNVRSLCCLRPGVKGLSENIRCYALVGRFLEHSRIYRFTNGGDPEYYLGSADWMKRNLDSRVETIVPVLDQAARSELDAIVETYERDNCSVWDCKPDGTYELRRPKPGEPPRAAQDIFAGVEVSGPQEPQAVSAAGSSL